ncbi:MAG TPA: tetratricopeptide repeat-containing glycosyltransferase family protein [Sedimentisphaerales bacterium]|nr:tetratricopeptide repeat-containing glycosyltransferase family protein [Sedimentisphaerales bacterium]
MAMATNPDSPRMTEGAFPGPQSYQKGLELAQAGRYQEALDLIQGYLRTSPADAQALNDAGAIMHCLGRSTEAIDHLVRARALQTDCAEIIWNLVEAYLADGRPAQAVPLFDQMERMGILNADVLNRTANVFLNQGNKADAVEMLLRSRRISPGQEVLRPMIDVILARRPRMAFFCGLRGDTKFLTDIYHFAKRRFPVRLFDGTTVDQMYELMRWSDISWFEWCTDMVVEASKLPKVCKNIVRLHRFEAYETWPTQVKWENIDKLITVGNSFVRDALLGQVPNIASRTSFVTIPNGINFDKLPFIDKTKGKNLACVGYLNLRKNPMFLLQCMQKLHYIDPAYRLFFAGTFQDLMLEQYVRHMVYALGLTDAVFFDGWQQDVNSWLQDKHYIVSCSIGESQGMGLLEGMACGLKPVIHNFPGAGQIFPSEYLFNISEDFCAQICSGAYDPAKYRRFVEEKYPLKSQLDRINEILVQMEREVDLERTQDVRSTPRQSSKPSEVAQMAESIARPFQSNGYANPAIA